MLRLIPAGSTLIEPLADICQDHAVVSVVPSVIVAAALRSIEAAQLDDLLNHKGGAVARVPGVVLIADLERDGDAVVFGLRVSDLGPHRQSADFLRHFAYHSFG